MADSGAWDQGWALGNQIQQKHADHKQAIADMELTNKAQAYATQLSDLQKKISALPKDSPEYQETFKAMQDTVQNVRTLFHPDTNPGLIAKAGHLITDALKITSPEQRQAQQATKQAAGSAQDAKQAAGYVAAAPLSPQQLSMQQVQEKIKEIDSSSLSPEDKDEAKRKIFSVSEKPSLKLYASPDGGTKAWLDANRPDAIPVGWTAYTAPNADANKRADFAKFQKEHPDYKGTFESWTSEQSATGRSAAPKPENLDTQYKAILVKKASGVPLTPDEIAHAAAWQIYNKESKIDPGVARAAAFGAMRYIPVVDASNPENVVMMRAGDAARSGANTPQSIGFKTDQAITRYMTSGAGGTNINYFNTATDHLRLLGEAGDALNNGDYPAFNKVANQFSTATGDPAPTNFETVKAAVAGELSKTFKGTGATDAEISDINTTINQAQSPQQIQGAIDYYSKLMGSKVHALNLQYEAGRQGKPNFPVAFPPPVPPGLGGPQAGGTTKKHKIKIGTKYYTYNGTGDTGDIKNYTEVKQ